jgi:hypothetical protein
MPYVVSASRFVPAPASAIFDLLADPANHPLIDGSGSVKAVASSAPSRLSLGATFGMDMKVGVPYKITNTVVEFEEDHLLAWRHFGGHVWRYRLAPADGGTEVTEEFDWTNARSRLFLQLMGYPEKNRKAMVRTLERLDEHFRAA